LTIVGTYARFLIPPAAAANAVLDSLPSTWTALCGLAFALGARHGFDADHLATIDGLTRYNARAHAVLARSCGALFSLGHGAVVCAVAIVAASARGHWHPPAWLEPLGVSVSIAFLFGLAFLNVRAVVAADAHAIVAPIGLRSGALRRFVTVRKPWAVGAVGALFALSFDTISQAALFALAAARFGGLAEALWVAALFVLGMLVVDGINGAWISGLVRRADRTAIIASRAMALAVAAISALVGTLAIARLFAPAIDSWVEQRGLAIGAAVIAGALSAFLVGTRVARRRPVVLRV
jgi:nickel/cobalt transporter (NiCoT) family protein